MRERVSFIGFPWRGLKIENALFYECRVRVSHWSGSMQREVVEVINRAAVALAETGKTEAINGGTRSLERCGPCSGGAVAARVIMGEDPDALTCEKRQGGIYDAGLCAEDRDNAEVA